MRYQTGLLGILAVSLLSACAPRIDDLVAYTSQVKQTTQVRIEPYPEFEAQPPFKYAAQHLRSPFSRPRGQNEAPIVSKKADCLQPNFQRTREELESYGLDALALSGSFSVSGKQWVLFKTNDGGLFKGTIGTHIGLFHGKIKRITGDAVVIDELLPDGAGCWQQKETTLTKMALTGEQDNV